MQYRNLGNTRLKVSVICLGSMTWGGQNTAKEAFEQLDFALSQGVNFIDTAELYAFPPRADTYGATESILGQWLQQHGKRNELILASKVCGNACGWVDHIRNGPRLNRIHMTQALNDSLTRLQTDYLDLYQIHWPARTSNYFGPAGYTERIDEAVEGIDETLAVLHDFVQQGKVRYIGISNETPWGMLEYLRLAERHNWPQIQSIQNPYNLLNRTFEIGLSEIAIREQVGLLAYSPLGFGVLSGKYLLDLPPENARLHQYPDYQRYSNPNGVRATQAYAQLAREHGLTPAQLALAFINSRPFLTANIIGATTLTQLRENIASIKITLSDDILTAIEQIHREIFNPCP